MLAGQRNSLSARCPHDDLGLARCDAGAADPDGKLAEELAAELAALVLGEPWLAGALDAVAASGLPDAWIGAGVIRDVVWGQRQDGFDPSQVRDIDVAFFDPEDLGRERDRSAQRMLARLAALPWEATNQAAVHTWYHGYFGGPPVAPFRRVHDAVATWPETATCVAIRRMPGPASGSACGPGGPGPGGTGPGGTGPGGTGPGGTEIPAATPASIPAATPAAAPVPGPASASVPVLAGLEICAPYGLADLLDMIWRPNLRRVTAEMSAARLERQRRRFPAMTVVPPTMAPPRFP